MQTQTDSPASPQHASSAPVASAVRDPGPGVRRGWTDETDPVRAAEALARTAGGADVEAVLIFCSPDYDPEALASALRSSFGETPLFGCTTAGEVAPVGYTSHSITAVGFPRGAFTVKSALIDQLSNFELANSRDLVHSLLGEAWTASPSPSRLGENSFAIMLVDGMSRKEEMLVSALYAELGSIPLVGGSAGDSLGFERSLVLCNGRFHTNAALVLLVGTTRPFHVFQTQHFTPTGTKMVITSADPSRRLVREINAEPAADEYARLVGVGRDELCPAVFASHPVLVRVGGNHYVRSIQKVEEDGGLIFYCAIDEGVVLTAGNSIDIAANLEAQLQSLHEDVGEPDIVLAFDCVLRRLEIEHRQLNRQISDILVRHGVLGFNTYGEQFNNMHTSQTLTGIAIGKA
ncbi:nitric oxide-sensing protein NosP [Azospirillum sp. SYSU D00513]|uniref:nitric oxide-sensing protein NosP n=1 Tax=Azospirillum sp. SYSU D00513 TaxID=2812561 RepID=UPI001A973573|nr:nitric oxide-sensing protein NosP [Azospirillum sp. SYSU D00513]